MNMKPLIACIVSIVMQIFHVHAMQEQRENSIISYEQVYAKFKKLVEDEKLIINLPKVLEALDIVFQHEIEDQIVPYYMDILCKLAIYAIERIMFDLCSSDLSAPYNQALIAERNKLFSKNLPLYIRKLYQQENKEVPYPDIVIRNIASTENRGNDQRITELQQKNRSISSTS